MGDFLRTMLIPAAGLGTRVGSPEAKEMLPRPAGVSFENEPMITMALQLAAECEAKPHVITREEKVSLVKYLSKMRTPLADLIAPPISVQLVGATREWPDTLLLSRPAWSDYN